MSEDIQEVLDHCIEEMKEGRTAEECLETYPQWRDELAPLLQLVTRLRSAPKVQPSATFRRNAPIRMANLIAERKGSVVESPPQRFVWGEWLVLQKLQRRLAIPLALVALLIASVIGGAGTVYASQDALPGDPLYGVKILVEDARLLLNTNEIGDAELHLEFASERLREAATLVDQGRPDSVEGLMDAYVQEMEAALSPLANGVDNEEMGLHERVDQSLNDNVEVLERVLAQVPDQAKPAIQHAIDVSGSHGHEPGPPDDVPHGPPADVPHGPPEDVPRGRPDDVPRGSHEGSQDLADMSWGQLKQYLRSIAAEHAGPPPHAAEPGPPPHAQDDTPGPPDHARDGTPGPPDHAQGQGPPPHAQDGEPGPPETPPGQDPDREREPPSKDKDKDKSKESR